MEISGYGIGLSRNEDDELFIKSLTQLPVYLIQSNSTEQIHLSAGKFVFTNFYSIFI